jgi:AcrR family transcriptional regulator
MSPYDSAATKTRLLDAAFDEFVQNGLAGARVDRIAIAAKANKQLIYAYFGSKEALFDAVLAERLGVFADEVPFTPSDLPGYAVKYFDYLIAHPEHLRMALWRRLERPDSSAAELEAYGHKIAEIANTFSLNATGVAAVNILLITLGLSMSWALAVPGISEKDDPAAIYQHREAMRKSVAAALAALLDPAASTKVARKDQK